MKKEGTPSDGSGTVKAGEGRSTIYRYRRFIPKSRFSDLSLLFCAAPSKYDQAGDAKNIGSDFWTVVGRDVNIGRRCFPSLIFVWISCLIIFGVAAFILAKQTFKTYKQQEEIEDRRKEMTDALAHDLKTPRYYCRVCREFAGKCSYGEKGTLCQSYP